MTGFRKWFMVCILLILAGLCACADQKTADLGEENNSSAYNTASTEKTGIEIWEKEWEENALESFGRYYVKLVQSDRLEELEEHIISVRLDLNEAALLGEYDALSHFEGFSEGKYNAREIFVLQADIDGDGDEDIIEYGMDNYLTFIHETSSISIYRNNGDDFELMYLQPRFDETYFHVSVPCRVEVVRYGEETFLVFRKNGNLITGSVEIFWIHGWDLAGKMRLISHFEQKVAVEQVTCLDGYGELAEEICANAAEIKGAGGNMIVSYSPMLQESPPVREKGYGSGACFWGSAEECVAGMLLDEGMGENYVSFLSDYEAWSGGSREMDEEGIIESMTECGWQIFRCDINNDGEEEVYIKNVDRPVVLSWDESQKKYLAVFLDSDEKYGRHADEENVLQYYMQSGGEEIDFWDMCGLDIWNRDLAPRMFWVEEAGGRNITLVFYQGKNQWEFEIVGYDIEGSHYTEVLKVAGHAVVDCGGWCEWKERESGGRFPYGVRIAYEESEQPKLYGMEDEEKQDAINEAIAAMVCEEAEHGILSEHYEQKYGYARYTLLRATEDEIIMDYGYEWRDEEGILRTNHFIFSVDIETNDCDILFRMDYDYLLERGDRFDEWFDNNRW